MSAVILRSRMRRRATLQSYVLGLQCPQCALGTLNTDLTTHPACPTHGAFQEAAYDIPAMRAAVDRDHLTATPKSIWRWGALLPVRDPANIVTLIEGDTPLLHTQRLGEKLGLRNLYIKDESRNPTGSFKDRGAS